MRDRSFFILKNHFKSLGYNFIIRLSAYKCDIMLIFRWL